MTIAEPRMDRMVASVRTSSTGSTAATGSAATSIPASPTSRSATRRSCHCPGWSMRSSATPCPATRTGSPTSSARRSRARSWPRRCGTGPASPIARGRRDDRRRVRRAGRDDPRAVRRGRRGHLPVAAVVLLRADDRVVRRDGRCASGSRRPEFDLDPDAIAAAITPRTRAVIVNSPNNPTGRIYREPELAALGRRCCARRRRATAGRSC